MKKKKKEKHKKKSKKSKHRKHSSDSSQSEDEWEEAESFITKASSKAQVPSSSEFVAQATDGCEDKAVKREDWMSSSLLDVACNAINVRKNETKEWKMEQRRKEEESNLKIYNARELNPYRETGQTVSVKQSVNHHSVGDGGNSWIHKAYERAKEQAKEQNVPLEVIARERWGSMEKLEALLRAATPQSTRSISKQSISSGWRKNVTHSNQHRSATSSGNASSSKLIHNTTGETTYVSNEEIKHNNSQNDFPDNDDDDDDRGTGTKESCSSNSSSNKIVTGKALNEKEKNELNAKILRAELMGDDDLVAELKRNSSGMPSDEKKCEMLGKGKRKDDASSGSEEEIILTRSDKHGNLYPIKLTTDDHNKSKRKKIISTHDDKSGERICYFEDDNSTDLKTMVEQEHLTSSDDHHAMLARLAGKHLGRTMGDDYTIDDMFVQASATKGEINVERRRIKKHAIAEDKQYKKQRLGCLFCFENPNIAKHLIITIGTTAYLSLPITASLTEGHCLIIPMRHVAAQTYLDEDVIQEVRKFKKALTRMFADTNGDDVMFLETCKNVHGQFHCVIECIPVPKEVGDMAPIYFKKAITEVGSEWSENKKLITITSKNGVTNTIPKGLPYFSIEFGLDGGFGHIIEDESFPHYFGKEIIGGMMDLEPRLWLKPPKESFELHKIKVLKFTESWKEYDRTSHT